MNLSWQAEYVPLALLHAGSHHGYDLHRRIGSDPVLRSIWRLGRSELYFLLRKLEKRGWIVPQATEVAQGPPRTTYAISGDGRQALEAWLASPVAMPRDLRAEFLAKLYLGWLLGAQQSHDLIRAQSEILQQRLRRLDVEPGASGFERHVLRLRHLQTEAALRWLGELDASLDVPPGVGASSALPTARSSWEV